MPPRRSHTKSRNGCDQCKKRRVKCDEKGPPCSNCFSREIKCTYLNIPKVNTLATLPTLPTLPTQSTSPSHLQNLELMHKFSTETYQSLCTDPSSYHVWQVVLPQKAFSHDFLLSGMLALASLHIATTKDAPDALPYIDTALHYYHLAFAPFRKALDSLSPLNCDAVFAHSVITTAIGIALPRMTADRGEKSSMTENIMVVFKLLQGVRNIHRISHHWLSTKLFSDYNFCDSTAGRVDADTEAALTRLTLLNDETVLNADADQYRINKDALALLHHCFSRFVNSLHLAEDVMAWLAIVDKDFVHCLRRRQPFSLLILMYWGVLLGQLDGRIWWARDSGKALVSELLMELRSDDLRWEAVRMWPQKKMGIK